MTQKIGPALATALVLGFGAVVLQRWVAETKTAAIFLVAIWFVLVGIGLLVATRSRPALRPMIGTTFAVVVLGSVAVGWWTGFRDTRVDEDIVVATAMADDAPRPALTDQGGRSETRGRESEPEGPVELASGHFTGADGHAGSGTANAIELQDESRVLTFSEFDVDPGARVEVWLTTEADAVDDRIELGALKGNVGDQQYDIPADADLDRYDTVVLYCTPFTVRIAVAPLT